jgi:hypothetical protein
VSGFGFDLIMTESLKSFTSQPQAYSFVPPVRQGLKSFNSQPQAYSFAPPVRQGLKSFTSQPQAYLGITKEPCIFKSQLDGKPGGADQQPGVSGFRRL